MRDHSGAVGLVHLPGESHAGVSCGDGRLCLRGRRHCRGRGLGQRCDRGARVRDRNGSRRCLRAGWCDEPRGRGGQGSGGCVERCGPLRGVLIWIGLLPPNGRIAWRLDDGPGIGSDKLARGWGGGEQHRALLGRPQRQRAPGQPARNERIRDHALRHGHPADLLDTRSFRAAAMREQAAVTGVDADDVGDVGGLMENLRHPNRRQRAGGIAGADEMAGLDENIGGRADVVTGVAMGIEPGLPAATGGWQRRPADAILAGAPGYPGGRPIRAGNPDPAVPGKLNPAAVVIADGAERLVRHPGPAMLAPTPAAIEIGAPSAVGGELGTPHVAMLLDIEPGAMRGQIITKLGFQSGRLHSGGRRRG